MRFGGTFSYHIAQWKQKAMKPDDFHERLRVVFNEVKQELEDRSPSGIVQHLEELEGLLNDEFGALHNKIEELGSIINEALETVWHNNGTATAENSEQSLEPRIPISLSLS